MSEVVSQLVGIGMVTGYVMKVKGFQRATPHGEGLHANLMHHHKNNEYNSAIIAIIEIRYSQKNNENDSVIIVIFAIRYS
jgi:hypothetical protein